MFCSQGSTVCFTHRRKIDYLDWTSANYPDSKKNCLPGRISEMQCDQICVRKQEKQVNPLFKTNIIKFISGHFCFVVIEKNVIDALSYTRL